MIRISACCGSANDPVESDMVYPGAEAPPAKEPEKIVVNLYFKTFAWAYCAAFFGTLFISGVLTFTSTNYSPETDKITLFYGMFNPCIWFDHYPAKVLATTGMGIFVLIGVAYSAIIFIYEFVEKRILKVMWAGALLCLVSILDLTFVNVFTTNLYPLEEELYMESHGVDDVRRLHGVHFGANNTVSLLEEGQLSSADLSVIKLHTAFYIIWIVGQLILSFHIYSLARDTCTHWTGADKGKIIGLFSLGWFGMGLHAAAMLIIIMHPEPKVEWYFQDTLTSIVQHIFIWVDAKTFTSAWGWAPIMFFRLVMPGGRGVRLTFRLEKMAGDHGHVMPEHWLNRCIWAFCLILAFAGVFDTNWEGDVHASTKLMVALGLKPYAYFGGPAFLACVIVQFVGLSLQVIQKTLLNNGQVPAFFAAHAVTLFALTFAVTLVILERATWVPFIFACDQIALLAWVWHMNKDKVCKGNVTSCCVYTALGLAVVLGSIFSTQWYMYFLFLAWMSLYGMFVPDGPWIYITAARIEDATYKEIPHAATYGVPYAP